MFTCESCRGDFVESAMELCSGCSASLCRRCFEQKDGRCHECRDSDAIVKQQAELKRLRAKMDLAGDHPLVMAEGGVDNVDRCHRVINKLSGELERLQAKPWPPPDEQEADILVWSATDCFQIAFWHDGSWRYQDATYGELDATHWWPLPPIPDLEVE